MRTVNKLILVTFLGLAADQALARGPAAGSAEWQATPSIRADASPYGETWRYAANDARDNGRGQQRWRDTPPEQRQPARSRLRDDWQNMPPEERQQHREEWLQRLKERGDRDRPDEGYGRGYGNRN